MNKHIIILLSVLILICSLAGCKTYGENSQNSIPHEESVINGSNKMNDEGVTYTLKVNEKVITENTVDVTAGDIILSLTEEISEDVAYKRIEGNYLSTGIDESILDIDYPAEEGWRDGTVVTSCEYHMKEVPSENVIHVTITKELQQRLGLERDVIQIHCK